MDNAEHLSTMKISKKLKNIINLSAKLLGDNDVTSLTEAQITEINKSPIPKNNLSKKLLQARTKTIEHDTFIIPVEDGALTGYFYEPKTNPTSQMTSLRPLIIFYHGGGWVWGNMELYQYICIRIASLTNAAVLAVDYRLSPQHKFPTAVEDSYSTLLWASLGARYWKIDPERIFVMGDSAGANLAAVVCRLARDRKGPHIAGQILLYPVTDGRMKTASYEEFKDSPTLTSKSMQFFIKSYQREPKDILNPLFSPLLAKDHSRLPPALIVGAEYDPLRDDARLYSEALESADTAVKYLECKETVHGYFVYPKAPGTEETESAIIQFISGRPVASISLMTFAELKKQNKAEFKSIKRNKDFIATGVEGS